MKTQNTTHNGLNEDNEQNPLLMNVHESVEKGNEEEIQNQIPANSSKIWFIAGAILLAISIYFFFAANAYVDGDIKIFGSEYDSMYKRYVGGDAYNYIIAGTYATTMTLRALFFAVLGSTSLLMGKFK